MFHLYSIPLKICWSNFATISVEHLLVHLRAGAWSSKLFPEDHVLQQHLPSSHRHCLGQNRSNHDIVMGGYQLGLNSRVCWQQLDGHDLGFLNKNPIEETTESSNFKNQNSSSFKQTQNIMYHLATGAWFYPSNRCHICAEHQTILLLIDFQSPLQ